MSAPSKKKRWDESGQAVMETALSAFFIAVLAMGVIDYSRAIYYAEVIKNLTGEGSSMASRAGTASLLQIAQTVVSDAGTNLNMTSAGCVIITAVLNNGASHNNFVVTAQSAPQGACSGINSKIGCAPPPTSCGTATLPAEAQAALQANQSLYITEIFYTFNTVTPIGGLLNVTHVLPSQFYDAAYY